jgi:succinate dehydrogenase/fumarate reductase flavoprotein subunit
VPGLYAAGDMACVPHNYLLGALTYGKICAENAIQYLGQADDVHVDRDAVEVERARVFAPLARPRGLPAQQYEYKVRRQVNDYLQPPKSGSRMELGLAAFLRARDELEEVGAASPHELMRVQEAGFIRDCAEMAARAPLVRTESRWGLYHHRLDFPEMDNRRWFTHVNLRKRSDGEMEALRRPVAPYVVPLDDDELGSYHRLRIADAAVGDVGSEAT